ncbi:hypothetical protein AGMMS50255_4210 [Spirochaetia bacterium]|nr:hypothetical protein AGMMS50255_4210 [Spirochaetia bacterium]
MKIRLFGILFIVSIILGGCDIDAPPQTVIMPTASPVAGEVASGTKITLATTTEGATILYTTDGNDPLTNGTSYSSPIAITSPVTIKAIAIKSGMTNSAVLSAAYTITKVTHSLNGFTAEEITGGLSITKYSGNLKNLVIPGSIDGIPVISLDGSPFYGEDTYGSDIYLQLISVVIPESVTHIGDSVFRSIDLFGYSKTSGTYLSGGITIGANVTIENNYGGGQRPDGTVIGVGHTGNFSAYERDHIGGWLDLGFTKFYNENGKKAGTYTWNYSYNSNNYKYTFTWSFNPSSSSNPGQEGKETNGSLTQTHWYAFGYHAVIGSQGNGEMDSSNQISIGVNTTTLTGDFWGDYQGTYPSFYLDHNPNLTIPTPPRVYVQVNSDDLIELVQGSHADYGTIIFVSLFPDGDRIDVYFRSSDTISIPGGNNNGDNGILYPQWQVSSFAGNGIPGFADGTGTATQFFTPVGIAVDTNGNIYVADTSNNRIRRITSSGVVTSFAGINTAGYANGIGTAARFSSPKGLAIDGDNIYVADTGNHCIKKITPERIVSNFAGTNTADYANGTGTAVRFSSPKGLTIDKDGNIYVADTGFHIKFSGKSSTKSICLQKTASV